MFSGYIRKTTTDPAYNCRLTSHHITKTVYDTQVPTAVRSIMEKDNNSKSRTYNNDYHCCCTRKCYNVCGHIPPTRGNYSSLINNNL